MPSPLVSAVVTSYNHAEFLVERMESLLAQTYRPVEIIVVDDASTDGSQDVLQRYGHLDNVRLILLERNGGYAAACNAGVAVSRGEYVMFAECDDASDPEQIEVLARALEREPKACAAFCRSRMVDAQGRVVGDDFDFREPLFKRLCRQDAFLPQETAHWLFLRSCIIPNMSAALFRRRDFNEVGGLDGRYRVCADWDFWCRMAERHGFAYIVRPLNRFRTHATTVRSKSSIESAICDIIDLLSASRAKARLSLFRDLRYRLNLGYIWASRLTPSPRAWLDSAPGVLRRGRSVDPLFPLAAAWGLAKKIVVALVVRVERLAGRKSEAGTTGPR